MGQVVQIKAWNIANEHTFSVLRLATTGTARIVLLKFEPRSGRQGNGKETWLALKNTYQKTSRQRRRTLLRLLDNSVTKPDIDPDVFLSKVLQLRDELNDLSETVTYERLTTIILNATPKEMYSTVKMQSVKYPDLGLEEIIGMMKTVFANYSERSSVLKRSQESYRKVRISDREPRIDNVRESTMILTCHNCKKLGHKKKDCKELIETSDKPSNVENGTRKLCSYLNSNGHSNENCYQQQQLGERWCTYHKSGSHSDDQCHHHHKNGSSNSPADIKSARDKTFVADNNLMWLAVVSVAIMENSKVNPRKMTNRTIRRLP